ncbi:F-box protein skip23 [Thalictrum thalictroides]|uniref:F-box protein skip23 n=1 Tax=Thalictrum thalictroides TaxID=46969 RepID=A0A7J6UYM5_THATH|nr:F-box protein skip23 [Thalictrum thalictroides]
MATRDWSQLPRDMLANIAKSLDTQIENLRFRSVCHSWRSSVLPTSPLTIKLPYPAIPSHYISIPPEDRQEQNSEQDKKEEDSQGYYTLVENTIYILQPHEYDQWKPESSSSSKSWLLKVRETRPGVLQTLSPLSRSPIKSIRKMFPEELNSLRFNISGVYKEYNLERTKSDYEVIEHTYDSDKSASFNAYVLQLLDRFILRKIVLSSTATIKDISVMAIHFWGTLIYFKSGNDKWTIIEHKKGPFHDLIHWKGNFFAVDGTGSTYIVDPHTSEVTQVVGPVGDCRHKKRFVISNGELFLVEIQMDFGYCSCVECDVKWNETHNLIRQWKEVLNALSTHDIDTSDDSYEISSPPEFLHTGKPIGCKVFKVDEENKKWVQVGSLGDQIFIVGDRCSFSITASEFLSACEGNCILFTDIGIMTDFYFMNFDEALNHDIGIFNVEDGSFDKIENHPSYSQLIWPPPTWAASPDLTCEVEKDQNLWDRSE